MDTPGTAFSMSFILPSDKAREASPSNTMVCEGSLPTTGITSPPAERVNRNVPPMPNSRLSL
ncbi:MAG: hypothetical protein BWY96_00121 [Spirochaetes bacterium ADurb.BinA120]|nr:MAG: hypothetical protein BWY96_00121 [Spirochaetes bacterium ADurb.BinA120]